MVELREEIEELTAHIEDMIMHLDEIRKENGKFSVNLVCASNNLLETNMWLNKELERL